MIEERKKIGIDEVIKRNEIVNNFKIINYVSKKTTCKQLIKMKSYCLKCRKDCENINPKVSNTSNGRKWRNYQNAQYVVVKNQDLLKIKKQKDY